MLTIEDTRRAASAASEVLRGRAATLQSLVDDEGSELRDLVVEKAADLGHQAADRAAVIGRLAAARAADARRYLDRRGAAGVGRDLVAVARAHPVITAATAFGLGYLVARVVRSRRAPEQADADLATLPYV